MDFISLFKLTTVRDPEPGETRIAFHFARKPESSTQEPRFDDVMRAYGLDVTQIMYTEFEDMLTLYLFATGYDWAAHTEETMKICKERDIDSDWKLMRMVMSTCIDNTESGYMQT